MTNEHSKYTMLYDITTTTCKEFLDRINKVIITLNVKGSDAVLDLCTEAIYLLACTTVQAACTGLTALPEGGFEAIAGKADCMAELTTLIDSLPEKDRIPKDMANDVFKTMLQKLILTLIEYAAKEGVSAPESNTSGGDVSDVDIESMH